MSKPMNREQRRKHAKDKARLDKQLRIHVQIGLDAAAIAANDVFHMGPSKVDAFAKAYTDAYMEICNKIVDNDADYAFTVLDRRLKQICGDKFMPYHLRYNMAIGGK